MDLREYEYITRRPDTFPDSTLKAIHKVLLNTRAGSAHLIEKILKDGYIEPPPEYKWHGCYKVILAKDEIDAVFADLLKAEEIAQAHPSGEKDELHYLKQYINYWAKILGVPPQTYDEYKAEQDYYDLRSISLEAFRDLVFDHPVPAKDSKKDAWYWSVNSWVEWDKPYVVALYMELFSRSHELLRLYPHDKLEQGCWFMMGSTLEFSTYELIRDDELDIALKEKLIASMYFLYERFFCEEPVATASYMWWDSFAYSYCVPGQRDPINNEVDRRIQDAMFSTLVKILSLDAEICQYAAVHGLGHLGHPGTEKVIKGFMKKHPNLTEKQIDYLNNAITGDIL